MIKRIGAHVSCSGGYLNGLKKAESIGANCMQIFSDSPQTWFRRPLDSENLTDFAQATSDADKKPIFTHAMYLLNLASGNPDSLQKSIDVLKHDLLFDSLIQGSGVVVHLGSHLGQGWDRVKGRVRDSITEILEETPENSTFLIENSAGQNGKLSSDFAEIRWLLDEIKSPRLGWCLDTCHAFAAGLSFGDLELVRDITGKLGETGQLSTAIAQYNLWDSLKCVHVNNSKDLFGSGRDRHENILEGNIPLSWLQTFLNQKELQQVPFILEVPGADGKGPDAENVKQLTKLIIKN